LRFFGAAKVWKLQIPGFDPCHE